MVNDTQKTYLTKEGLERFRAEFVALQARRKEVVQEEENEEEIALIDHRLAELDTALQSYELIGAGRRTKADAVELGTTVTVEAGGRTKELTIVGPLEVDPARGKVSHVSPVGKALLGKKVGDVVLVRTNTDVSYRILGIGCGGSGRVRAA